MGLENNNKMFKQLTNQAQELYTSSHLYEKFCFNLSKNKLRGDVIYMKFSYTLCWSNLISQEVKLKLLIAIWL